MIVDILMAFAFAAMIELVTLQNKHLKSAVVFVCCATSVIAYFANDSQFDFIGSIDITVWIMFVIMFNIVLSFVAEKIYNHIKE